MVNTCGGSQKLRARKPGCTRQLFHLHTYAHGDPRDAKQLLVQMLHHIATSGTCKKLSHQTHRKEINKRGAKVRRNQEAKPSILRKQHTFTHKNQENQLMLLSLWCHSHTGAVERASLYRVVAHRGQLCIWVQLQAPWVHLTTERAQLICHLQTWHKWLSTFLFLSLPVVWRKT